MPRLKPLPRSARQQFIQNRNRGRDISKKDKLIKDVSIGLMSIDAAIMYYFEKVIKPTVEENGAKVVVPILYSSPERWKAIQKDGYLRDKKNQVIIPLIVFKRTSIEKDASMAVDKLDANNPNLFYTMAKQFTKENRYSDYKNQKGIIPSKEYYSVAIPDYMIMNYECSIWTTYVAQMNEIVEKINWSEGSYWGEPDKFKFKVNIESFTDASTMDEGERMIKTTFNFNFRGYLIPESFNNYVNTKLAYTPSSLQIINEGGLSMVSLFNPSSRTEVVKFIGNGIGPTVPSSLGRATDYIRGVAPAVGQQTQDLEFTNTFGGSTIYVMRGTGEPSSSLDTKCVLNLGYGNSAYYQNTSYFSGSQSSSLSADTSGSVYQPILDSGKQLVDGTVEVQINGMELTCNASQSNAAGVDFYLSSSFKDVIIKNVNFDYNGINIESDDDIVMTYQSEII